MSGLGERHPSDVVHVTKRSAPGNTTLPPVEATSPPKDTVQPLIQGKRRADDPVSPPPLKRQRILQSEDPVHPKISSLRLNIERSNSYSGARTTPHDDVGTLASNGVATSNGSDGTTWCYQCKKNTIRNYDVLDKCPSCNRHFHAGCRKPFPKTATEREIWRCFTCIRKGRTSLPNSATSSIDFPIGRHYQYANTDSSPRAMNAEGKQNDPSSMQGLNALSPQENIKSSVKNRNLASAGVSDSGSSVIFESNASSGLSRGNLDGPVHGSIKKTTPSDASPVRLSATSSRSEIPPTPTMYSSQLRVGSPAPRHLEESNSVHPDIVSLSSPSTGSEAEFSTSPKGLSNTTDSEMYTNNSFNKTNIVGKAAILASSFHGNEGKETLGGSLITSPPDNPRLAVAFDKQADGCKFCRIVMKETTTQSPSSKRGVFGRAKHGKFTYRELIGLALLSAGAPLTVAEIRDWMIRTFPRTYDDIDREKGVGFLIRNIGAILSTCHDFRKASTPGQRPSTWTFVDAATQRRYFIASEMEAISDEPSLMFQEGGGANDDSSTFEARPQRSHVNVTEMPAPENVKSRDEPSNSPIETSSDAIKVLKELIAQVPENAVKHLNRVVDFLDTHSLGDSLQRKNEKNQVSHDNLQRELGNNQNSRELRSDLKLELSFDKAYPEYSEPSQQMTKDEINKKIQEIKKRPSKKANFGRLLTEERYLRTDIHNELGHHGKTTSTDPEGDVVMGNEGGATSLKEALNLPSITIPILHEGQLAFRDGSTVNGKLSRSRVIYRTGKRF